MEGIAMPEVFGFGDNGNDGPYVKEGFIGLAVPLHNSVEIAIRSGSETGHYIWQPGKILLIKPGTSIYRPCKNKQQNSSKESTGRSEKDPGTSEEAESSKERLVVFFTMFKSQKT
jgi:hypothetical protein